MATAQVRAWQDAYRGLLEDSLLDSLDVEERTNRWASILRGESAVPGLGHSHNFVAQIDEDVVGLASVDDYRDAPSEEVGELWTMYVIPALWGVGIGTDHLADEF